MRINKEEISAGVIHECKIVFSKGYQNEHHPERDWLGDSWLANLFLVYTNDYVLFSTFLENELEERLFEYVLIDHQEYDWAWKIVTALMHLFEAEANLRPNMTYDELGLELEKSHGF
jgi:hypothetical protein